MMKEHEKCTIEKRRRKEENCTPSPGFQTSPGGVFQASAVDNHRQQKHLHAAPILGKGSRHCL